MAKQFSKHRQPRKSGELAKLRTLAIKGKERAKADWIGIAMLRQDVMEAIQLQA